MNRPPSTSPRAGFTLVELLVVIGIIAVLMSLILGASHSTTDASRRSDAQNTCKQIVGALNAYYTDYARFPAIQPAGANGAQAKGADVVVGDPDAGAPLPNNVLFDALRNIPRGPNQDYVLNPRRSVYFAGKPARLSSVGKPRNGFFDKTAEGGAPPENQAGCLYDPWGRQFGVVFDASGDERINLDGYYTDFTGDDPVSGESAARSCRRIQHGKGREAGQRWRPFAAKREQSLRRRRLLGIAGQFGYCFFGPTNSIMFPSGSRTRVR
jgi:prepilin-type N-terminal cleavage/methylation domain-containing protein